MNRYQQWRRERARVAPTARRFRAAWDYFFNWKDRAKALAADADVRLEWAVDELCLVDPRFARNRYRRAKT